MKNLHLFPNDKFTEPYIDFVNDNFNPEDHLFIVIGEGIGAEITKRNNVKEIAVEFRSLKLLVNEMNKSYKIFLHGLFIQPVVILLFFQPWLLKKSYWAVWGADLYAYRHRNTTFKKRFLEFFRKFVIKRLAGLITEIKGDYNLAKEWYGIQGRYYYSFVYPSNLYKEVKVPDKAKEDKVTYIQIGNSADPSNNHLEVFERLKSLADQDIQLLVPLSYGNREYAKEVQQKGKELFGEKFKALPNFIPYDEYINTLAKIDIAIFNHDRQQALGNITSLLSFGKKIYIRDDITTWKFCLEHGFTVYSANKELDTLLEPLADEVKKRNQKRIKEQFSADKLIDDLNKVFA